jgi:hypothetical protein
VRWLPLLAAVVLEVVMAVRRRGEWERREERRRVELRRLRAQYVTDSLGRDEVRRRIQEAQLRAVREERDRRRAGDA